MLRQADLAHELNVAPLVGAWIEIRLSLNGVAGAFRRTSYWCGD
ncbi:hypothetical protein BTJ48_03336 [Bacillus mycoides]|nr:hypothetical protein [Bacillus mycoides]OSY06817.1 hypothetical protein BTJ48_03336 [Bacillus mycoides]